MPLTIEQIARMDEILKQDRFNKMDSILQNPIEQPQSQSIPSWSDSFKTGFGLNKAVGYGTQMIQSIPAMWELAKSIAQMGFTPLTAPPEAAQTIQGLSKIPGAMYDRWSDPMKTMREDPAGAYGLLGDASMLATGGGSLLSKVPGLAKTGQVISKVGAMAEPITAVTQAVGVPLRILSKTNVPEWAYGTAMKMPPGSLRIEERAQILDYLVRKEKLSLGSNTRDKLNNLVETIEKKIQPTLDSLSVSGSEFDMAPVYKELDDLKITFANRRNAKEVNAIIDEVKRTYMDHDFITKTEMSPLQPTTNILYQQQFPWIETKPITISREAGLSKAQTLKKGAYAELETFYKKGAAPETARAGLKNDFDSIGVSKVASKLRENILNHPDTPNWIKPLLEREAGAMQARKWVERAANRGANIDPMSLGSMAFGILTEAGVPAALAYQIGGSRWFLSKMALLAAHPPIKLSSGMSFSRAGARQLSLNPYNQMAEDLMKQPIEVR